jgi:acetyltransferase-like isoleucine patch superfamily enzyme
MNEKVTLQEGAAHSNTLFGGLGEGGTAFIGKHSFITRSVVGRFFGLGCYSFVSDSVIGDFCSFGNRVSVGAFSHPLDRLSVHEIAYRNTREIYGDTVIESEDYPERKITEFGSDIWLGDNVVCRCGIKIGHGSVIGAGSIVTKDVPEYSIVAGNPARIIRPRFSEKTVEKLLDWSWWEMPFSIIKTIDFRNIEAAIEQIAHYKVESANAPTCLDLKLTK